MRRTPLRILSLALAILLVAIMATPVNVEAVALTDTEITQQIKTTYKSALKYFRRSSFDGFCGAYVSVQIYLMGITSQLIGGDGNQQFDTYKRMDYTDMGYRVKAYPASGYTLKQALNTITQDGTRDAYNILVGYQKTKSTAGKKYGHATVVHAILDGKVYFSESYRVAYKSKSYKEGAPIVLSIDDFCSYYAATTTQLDGVIWFGLKTYADGCKSYSASYYLDVQQADQIYSQPCLPEISDESRPIRESVPGEQLVATGLYKNTEGEYWYQIDIGEVAYIPATGVEAGQLITSDVQLSKMKAPTSLRQGRSFNVTGSVLAQTNTVSTIRAQVYKIEEDTLTPVINATADINGKYYNLKGSKIASGLTFRKLAVGDYRLEISVILSNSYMEDGQMLTRWDSVVLWLSDFYVAKSTTNSDTVVFDACGGTASLNQISVNVGQAIGILPTAQRLDYVFLGWYTEMEGGERVTAGFVPDDSTTLYARWSSIEQIHASWQDAGECWYFYSDGLSTVGCIEIDGVLYYFSTMDPMNTDDLMWTAADAV